MKISFSKNALKEVKKLDKSVGIKILKKLKEIESLDNPRDEGKPLVGNLSGLWRYRVGGYRIICKIKDHELIVLILGIKNRNNAYDSEFDSE
ncbi:type II toxin-antitoxin system RelE family toxin [Campylobacter pinnipediorum]|uniref:type II toxin-antitoxin system RelE family toxin n=1 Tax=Campylobacter pinnipediorum TaxID=1965231 RepID=UPI0009959D07|nr:type II toxin-antitoxin system RelE/ParE family toxin [Campylobacter pinnipediorum]AQW83577.1 toxin-antitoxin system, toxin component, RelE/ParE family [Campylobacter pinnipediorum subsp. pinnipediorum]AQW85099.1 toxin-antitoxin system, toxin component, RelE/ParE family [Campylobacter pinnipediorum subsp. pinnipediorum]